MACQALNARTRLRQARDLLAVASLALVFTSSGSSYSQENKLEPGWFSLDSSVGLFDQRVQEVKARLEKALGLAISGLFDMSFTWSSNRPGRAFDRDISGRYFDQDHNDVVFNAFNLTLEKPEKDCGVGIKLVADFGRTGELLREATY